MSKITRMFLVIIGISIVLISLFHYQEKGSIAMMKTYVYGNMLYGFSFKYSNIYELTSKEMNDHFEVILVDKNDLLRKELEGPTSIQIHVYKNITIEDWLKTNESNFNLATNPAAEILFRGQKAIIYDWDGLYRGKTVVFNRGENLFAITGTYLEKNDTRYKDFDNILDSFMLRDQIQDDAVMEYVKKNISKLSPQKEVLGGTFYITKFTRTAHDSAIIEYEDGHNSYKAKVSFSLGDEGDIGIVTFESIQ